MLSTAIKEKNWWHPFNKLFSSFLLHLAPDKQRCQHLVTQSFLQPYTLSDAQLTVSKHWRQNTKTNKYITNSVHTRSSKDKRDKWRQFTEASAHLQGSLLPPGATYFHKQLPENEQLLVHRGRVSAWHHCLTDHETQHSLPIWQHNTCSVFIDWPPASVSSNHETNVLWQASKLLNIKHSDWLIDSVKVLRPTQHKIGQFGDVAQANLLAWYGKNLTQQNQRKLTNQKICTTRKQTQN